MWHESCILRPRRKARVETLCNILTGTPIDDDTPSRTVGVRSEWFSCEEGLARKPSVPPVPYGHIEKPSLHALNLRRLQPASRPSVVLVPPHSQTDRRSALF